MTDQQNKITIKSFLNPVTIISGLVILIGLIFISLIILLLGRDPLPLAGATPEVTIIAAPTLTPTTQEPTPIPTPTQTPVSILPEGAIGVGRYVQVTGTSGQGLRMRSEPGLDSDVNFTAMDAEAFLVIDGPMEADGYTWWHLEAPYDSSRNGWSAGAFLETIDEDPG